MALVLLVLLLVQCCSRTGWDGSVPLKMQKCPLSVGKLQAGQHAGVQDNDR